MKDLIKKAIKENQAVLKSLVDHDSGKKVINTDRLAKLFPSIKLKKC